MLYVYSFFGLIKVSPDIKTILLSVLSFGFSTSGIKASTIPFSVSSS